LVYEPCSPAISTGWVRGQFLTAKVKGIPTRMAAFPSFIPRIFECGWMVPSLDEFAVKAGWNDGFEFQFVR